MAEDRRMDGKSGKARSQNTIAARSGTDHRDLPAHLCLDNALLGVEVRVPDPAGGDGWIAASVSLTAFTDASDGELLATGLRTEADAEWSREPEIPNRPEFRGAVERWISKHTSIR